MADRCCCWTSWHTHVTASAGDGRREACGSAVEGCGARGPCFCCRPSLVPPAGWSSLFLLCLGWRDIWSAAVESSGRELSGPTLLLDPRLMCPQPGRACMRTKVQAVPLVAPFASASRPRLVQCASDQQRLQMSTTLNRDYQSATCTPAASPAVSCRSEDAGAAPTWGPHSLCWAKQVGTPGQTPRAHESRNKWRERKVSPTTSQSQLVGRGFGATELPPPLSYVCMGGWFRCVFGGGPASPLCVPRAGRGARG